ncbi:hypothetical protein BBOV_I003390 [Babesia bovis T2Bo]|uniref:Uncharacterized protein n=1 Tax=Babesia bovis TaxID=5865 RepID=A7AWJ3_BABBO|nr:hypothetical protein BBOV_I003390 [Babesia bovis T2Bo]EDO05421.1 hypothetical protein BBOV_I003390 [Babesia bovis T2Bo]|eukprot:XP_001608989.1 hypothetical protein [Babesia bovis T2Bo]
MDETSQHDANTLVKEEVPEQNELLVALAYNVPQDYTLYQFEQLINEHVVNTKHVKIIPPYPWQDKAVCPWKLVFDYKSDYDTTIQMEELIMHLGGNSRNIATISFIPGDADDIPDIPFKEDENQLMSEHCNPLDQKDIKTES